MNCLEWYWVAFVVTALIVLLIALQIGGPAWKHKADEVGGGALVILFLIWLFGTWPKGRGR